MRRGPLVLIAVLPFTTFASAQTPGGQTQSEAVRASSRDHANEPGQCRRSSDVIRSRQRRSGDQGRTARSDAQPAVRGHWRGHRQRGDPHACDDGAGSARHGDWPRLPGLRRRLHVRRSDQPLNAPARGRSAGRSEADCPRSGTGAGHRHAVHGQARGRLHRAARRRPALRADGVAAHDPADADRSSAVQPARQRAESCCPISRR